MEIRITRLTVDDVVVILITDNINCVKFMRVDQNIVDAVKNYFRYGWEPGSCTTLMLRGKYDEARTHAHPHIKNDVAWADHVKFIETCVPLCCRGENVSTWQGYIKERREDPSFASLMRLTVADDHFVSEWARR
jgi:hypothetical protein